jgi:hypothetical protein
MNRSMIGIIWAKGLKKDNIDFVLPLASKFFTFVCPFPIFH